MQLFPRTFIIVNIGLPIVPQILHCDFQGVVELIYKPLQYYIHERVWYKWIKFGLISTPEKKKKNVVITEEKTKPVVKDLIEETPVTLPPTPPQSSKKVLNYSSNR